MKYASNTSLRPVNTYISAWELGFNSGFPFDFGWHQSPVGQPLPRRVPPMLERWSEGKWKKRTMQDLLQRDLRGFFNGSLDPHPNVAVDAGLDRAYVIRPQHVLGNLKENGKPFTLSEPMHTAGELYSALADPVFKDIDIGNDPFDRGFSIWFLVRDLMDLKHIGASVVKILSHKGVPRSIPGTFRDVAQAHVLHQYGIAPSVADIHDFVDIIKRICNAYFGKGQFTKLYTAHAKTQLVPAKSFSKDLTFQQELTSATVHAEYDQRPIMAFLTLKYYFVCPELTGFLSHLRAIADILGLADPAGLWDILPWSFVIDWFFDVQTFLHKHLRPKFLPVDLVIADACQSIHIDGNVRTSMSGKWGWTSDCLDVAAPLPTQVNKLFAESTYNCVARRRVFPYPIRVNPPKLKLGTGLTIRRIIMGHCLVGLRSQVKVRSSSATHYRSRAPHLASNRSVQLRDKLDLWRHIRD